MKRITLYLASCLLIIHWNTLVAQTQFQDTVKLAKIKTSLQQGTASKHTVTAFNRLVKRADHYLTLKNPTVMDKSMVPPSGNKHDYMSLSRYWWPNPDTPDKLPWIRKDGQTNPTTQSDMVDRNRLGHMAEGVWNLSLAYYYTGNATYAKKAVSMIETWFLAKETAMNPNLNFAQGVPGRAAGRAPGVLDGRLIPLYIPDALTLLKNSGLWSENHQNSFNSWLKKYLNWLLTSDLGSKESKQPNNHGTWYKYQIIALATYLNRHDLAKDYMNHTLEGLNAQLTAEGAQPHELKRTRSFFYSCYNLQALYKIASVGATLGMELKDHVTTQNKSTALAISYLTPVMDGEKWQHPSLTGPDISLLAPVLYHFRTEANNDQYIAYLKQALDVMIAREFGNKADDRTLQELWLLHDVDRVID